MKGWLSRARDLNEATDCVALARCWLNNKSKELGFTSRLFNNCNQLWSASKMTETGSSQTALRWHPFGMNRNWWKSASTRWKSTSNRLEAARNWLKSTWGHPKWIKIRSKPMKIDWNLLETDWNRPGTNLNESKPTFKLIEIHWNQLGTNPNRLQSNWNPLKKWI